MGITEIFWFIFLFMFFIPMLQKRLNAWQRQRMLSSIEQKRESRVILLVHRQETMSLFGFPLIRYIDINDAEDVLRAIKMTEPDVPIDLVLHTPGGLVLPSLQIARAIHHHPARTTVFVPHFAMSGGTLIALAADEIVMSEHAVMGPVDPQINQMPASSITSVVRSKPISEIEDQTLILADVSRKATRQICLAVQEVLKDTMDDEHAREVAEILSRGAWTHDYPLHHEVLSSFGLNVKTDMPEEIYDLLSLYSQPTERRGNVEYTPLPRGRPGNGGRNNGEGGTRAP